MKNIDLSKYYSGKRQYSSLNDEYIITFKISNSRVSFSAKFSNETKNKEYVNFQENNEGNLHLSFSNSMGMLKLSKPKSTKVYSVSSRPIIRFFSEKFKLDENARNKIVFEKISENLWKAKDVSSDILTEFEIDMISYIAKGADLKLISQLFKNRKISPNSLSSLEKNLNALKKKFSSKTNAQLIYKLKNYVKPIKIKTN